MHLKLKLGMFCVLSQIINTILKNDISIPKQIICKTQKIIKWHKYLDRQSFFCIVDQNNILLCFDQ